MSTNTSKGISRRAFLLHSLVGLEAAVLAACSRGSGPEGEPTRIFLPPTEAPWSTLPAATRIDRLEQGTYPKQSEFDVRRELVLASAELFKEHVSSVPLTAVEIAQRVHFVPEAEFMTLSEAEAQAHGVIWDEVTREKFRKNTLGITTQENQIYMNTDTLNAHIARVRELILADKVQGRDSGIIAEKSAYLHEFAHMFETKEKITNLRVQFSDGTTITRFDNLEFYGETADGASIRVRGAKEASTDYVAWQIATSGNGYFFPASFYRSGFDRIGNINERAGLTPEEFITYYVGEKSFIELFERWGRLTPATEPIERQANGQSMFLVIGLLADESITAEEADRLLKVFMSQPSPAKLNIPQLSALNA